MDIEDFDTLPEDEKITSIMDAKWKFSLPYSIASAANPEERQPVWYVMDEFGARVQHSNEPNFRAVPFLYMGDGLGYSLLFPVCDVSEGEEVTRDYVECPEAADSQVIYNFSNFK